MSKPRIRAAGQDLMTAWAVRLHPHKLPTYCYQRCGWYWTPPWAEPGAEERLGANMTDALQALYRLAQRVRCPHDQPITVVCPVCRDGLRGIVPGVGQPTASARAGSAD